MYESRLDSRLRGNDKRFACSRMHFSVSFRGFRGNYSKYLDPRLRGNNLMF